MPLSPRFTLEPVLATDFEALLALRIRAMRPSLERLGRFDPERARERFAAGFAPEFTRHVVVDSQRVGCVTLRHAGDAMRLDHLYIDPRHQARGTGRWLMRWVKAQADLRQLPLELAALKHSDAHRFYLHHGLQVVGEGEWDLEYRRAPAASPLDAVKALWARYQARDWAAARGLMRADAVAHWWTSGERFEGADAIVRVNAIYPEGWTIHVLEASLLQDGRVFSLVRVDHPPASFYATSLWGVEDGLIAELDETWATVEEPPAWRSAQSVPGWRRFDALGAAG